MSDSSKSAESDLSDLDDNSDGGDEHDYFIVEFTKRGPKSKKCIDIVPKSWVSYQKSNGKLVAKFMKPRKNNKIQYTAEDVDLIHKLVELKADAPEDWPTYNCIIRGRAKTHEEAKIKLEALHHKDDVFTTDSNLEPDQKRQEIEQALKRKTLQEKLTKAREFMITVPSSPSSSNDTTTKHTKQATTSNQSNPDDCLTDNTKDLDRLATSKNSTGHKRTDCIEDETDLSGNTVSPAKVIQRNKRRRIEKELDRELLPGATARTLSNTSVFPDDILVEQRDEILPADKEITMMEELVDIEFRFNQTMADVESRFTRKLTAMESHLTTIQTGIGQIIALLNQGRREVIPQDTTFADRYSITLPCLTVDDITELNTKLQSNPCRQEFNDLINAGVDVVSGLSKSTTRMLKMCLRRQVALKLTAVKQMPNKIKIKDMAFADIIASVLKRQFPTVTEKDIWSAVGDALSNSKDWEGYRKKRTKKTDGTASANNSEGE